GQVERLTQRPLALDCAAMLAEHVPGDAYEVGERRAARQREAAQELTRDAVNDLVGAVLAHHASATIEERDEPAVQARVAPRGLVAVTRERIEKEVEVLAFEILAQRIRHTRPIHFGMGAPQMRYTIFLA